MSGSAARIDSGSRFDFTLDRTVQTQAPAASERTYGSQTDALAAINNLPPSDTDYGVVDVGEGRFAVRPLTEDFKPNMGPAAHLNITPRLLEADQPVVAVVFRDAENTDFLATSQTVTSQTVTASGATTATRDVPTELTVNLNRGVEAEGDVGGRRGILGSGQ